MVLENSSSSPTDFIPDEPLAPDGSNGELQSQTWTPAVDFASLPQPFIGWSREYLEHHVKTSQLHYASLIRRPLTHEESAILAHISAKEIRTLSYGYPLGAAAGLWRAYDTRSTWRWPFLKMPEGFNPEAVRILGIGDVLSGGAAKTFWRLGRGSAYAAIGASLGTLLLMPYAMAVASVETVSDPRLKDYVKLVSQNAEENRKKGIVRGQRKEQPGDQYGQGSTPMSDLWKDHRQSIGGTETQYDETSPTAGRASGEVQDFGYNKNDSRREYGSGSMSSSQPRAQVSATRGNRTDNQQDLKSDPSPRSSSLQPFDSFDDASPTAPVSMPSNSSQPSGSAWDRIRQNAGSSGPPSSRSHRFGGPQVPSNRTGGDSDASGDAFSFSSADEDRQVAQNQAQNSFNAGLERERQGEAFGSQKEDSGGRRRW